MCSEAAGHAEKRLVCTLRGSLVVPSCREGLGTRYARHAVSKPGTRVNFPAPRQPCLLARLVRLFGLRVRNAAIRPRAFCADQWNSHIGRGVLTSRIRKMVNTLSRWNVHLRSSASVFILGHLFQFAALFLSTQLLC